MPWRGPEFEGEFPSLGWQIVESIERYLCHGPGDVMGEPIVLDDEFVEFVVRCYALDPLTGRRSYRRAFLSRPKGRAKSELAGMLVCAEALFPVRFSHWDAAGEPVGKPVRSPTIRCLATEEGQSGNTYDNVRVMLSHVHDVHGERFPNVDVGLSRVLLPDGGEIIPSTASNASKDGGKETFAVFDETHLYNLPELRRMHETVRRNLRKRRDAEPWALETSTMYRSGEDSVAERTHAYAKAIAEGKVKERGLLFFHKEAPADTDLNDRESLLAGLKYVYGPAAAWMDLDGIIAEIQDLQSDPTDSRRYWLNMVQAASDAWLSEPEWRSVGPQPDGEFKVITDGEVITLGFDGSRSRVRGVTDATALIGCRVSDGHIFELGVWEQPDGPSGVGWGVPVLQVEAAVAHAFGTYTVVGLYADPAKWESVISQWEGTYGSRLKVKASRDHPCYWWMTGGRATFTARALERFHNAILDRELSHDGSYALTRHALNAHRRTGPRGLQIGKEHPDSPRKIDAVVAAVLAFEARADALSAGVVEVRTRSKRLHRF